MRGVRNSIAFSSFDKRCIDGAVHLSMSQGSFIYQNLLYDDFAIVEHLKDLRQFLAYYRYFSFHASSGRH